jgi:hypothetical protein
MSNVSGRVSRYLLNNPQVKRIVENLERQGIPATDAEIAKRLPRGSESAAELESALQGTERLPAVPTVPSGRALTAGAGLAGGAALYGREKPGAEPETPETPDTLAARVKSGLAAGGVTPPEAPAERKPGETEEPGKPGETEETLDQQRERLVRETEDLISKGYTPSRTNTRNMLSNLETTISNLPEVDQEKYSRKLDELSNAYKEYSTRSEWAEVAEMIGQSLVSMAASIAGVFVDPRAYLRPTDWEARRGRRLAETETAAARVERERAVAEREAERLGRQKVGLAEQNLRLAEREDEAATQAAKDKFRARIDSNLDKIKLISDLQERLRREEATRAEKASEVDKSLRSAQISQLRNEIGKREEQLQAVTEASLLLQAQKDLGRKEADKLVRTNAATMARAGVTPELLQRIDAESTKKGLIWDSIDQDKKKELIQQYVVAPKERELRMLQGQLSGILAGGEGGAPPAQPAQPAQPSGTVRVRHKKTGETRELTREQAARLPSTEFEITQ